MTSRRKVQLALFACFSMPLGGLASVPLAYLHSNSTHEIPAALIVATFGLSTGLVALGIVAGLWAALTPGRPLWRGVGGAAALAAAAIPLSLVFGFILRR